MRRPGGVATIAALPIALTVCALTVCALTGCTAPDATDGSAPTASERSTSSPTPVPPSTVPGPTTSGETSSPPTGTPTETAPESSTAPATTAPSDPGRPRGQCPDDALGVTVVPAADGGAAGSSYSQILFTNTGGETCVLRGTPGVSVVDASGAQVGPAASRNQAGARDIRLAVGGSAVAQLQIVDIGTTGGPLPGCRVVRGAGYRVYPPHSTTGFVVADRTAAACASGPVFLTVGPVASFGG